MKYLFVFKNISESLYCHFAMKYCAIFDKNVAKIFQLQWNMGNIFDIFLHEENFMAIFTTFSVVIWFSTGTLGIFATLVYVFTMRVIIYDIMSMAIIPRLSTSILFFNLCYILLWILPRSVVKIAIRIYSQKINTVCSDFYHIIW